jgi:hypothetical protein
MRIITETISQLDGNILLNTRTQFCLELCAISVSVIQKNDQIVECSLICDVKPDIYLQIDTDRLFNFKPELRHSLTGGEFQPEANINIKATLKPDLLPELAPHATTAEEAANYLIKLNQENPNHPLFYTENWLALSVTQQQEHGEVGYTTLWNTLNPSAIAAGTLTEADITHALTQFFSDWTESHLSSLTETATAQILTEVGNFFNDLADTSIDTFAELVQTNPSSDTLLSQIITFFTEDDWSFTKLQGESALRMAFEGENGEWACYAKAREEQEQFIFYSICPIAAPEDQRSAIAEFLTRANYGMTIGNFELDYTDGEIRYKTSIDVEGEKLTSALIKRLVYTNVAMMDEYLPGIHAMIKEGLSAEAAIQTIEAKILD